MSCAENLPCPGNMLVQANDGAPLEKAVTRDRKQMININSDFILNNPVCFYMTRQTGFCLMGKSFVSKCVYKNLRKAFSIV